jgi:hypothetical protein
VRHWQYHVTYNVINYSIYWFILGVFCTKEMREATVAAGGIRVIRLRRAGEARGSETNANVIARDCEWETKRCRAGHVFVTQRHIQLPLNVTKDLKLEMSFTG